MCVEILSRWLFSLIKNGMLIWQNSEYFKLPPQRSPSGPNMPQPRTWLKASKSAARPQHHEEHGDDAVNGDEDGHKCSQFQPFSMPKRKADQTPSLLACLTKGGYIQILRCRIKGIFDQFGEYGWGPLGFVIWLAVALKNDNTGECT